MTEPQDNAPSAAEFEAAKEKAKAEQAAREAERASLPPRLPLSPLQSLSLKIAVAAAVMCPLWFAVAALGTKFGLWGYPFGLGKMTFQWGPLLLMAALVIAAVTMVIQLVKPPRRGVIIALVALLVPGMMMMRAYSTQKRVLGLPPIHDIQTDWSRPVPPPEAHVSLRGANGWNPILENPAVSKAAGGRWPDAVGKTNAELQEENYNFLKPLIIQAPVDVVLEFAEGIAEKQGWAIESVNAEAGIIHATSTSTWFGFTDDIFIRVGAQGPTGARIDLRSVSRVGLSDMGANAARVKAYLDDAHLAARRYGSSEAGG